MVHYHLTKIKTQCPFGTKVGDILSEIPSNIPILPISRVYVGSWVCAECSYCKNMIEDINSSISFDCYRDELDYKDKEEDIVDISRVF